MKKIKPQEYDLVLLKNGKKVGLIDQLDETHFWADYGIETEEEERLFWEAPPVSVDDIEKVLYRPE
ncbi:hypothetical protein NOU10_04285 [Ligilactobacillus sp. MP3]|uniref:hypothetical protein n=1 Tax=Ligilactobacillus TaxID=2767887 RepID=UPI0009DA082E|nr:MULTISPECIES: hypothetical protein [Ligilactobacillus]MBM6773459.1 hypothetical protein [Ligilactobacillus agilis]MCQ4116607.1 hypothetical protein [Ligilactobacillus sp. MP3]OQQ74584.1 hypothetical protein B6U63_02570 [Ligilactobacillus salivarius]UNL43192.1 hypothetical protein G8B22_08630 [Ligilactobacillus agilis]